MELMSPRWFSDMEMLDSVMMRQWEMVGPGSIDLLNPTDAFISDGNTWVDSSPSSDTNYKSANQKAYQIRMDKPENPSEHKCSSSSSSSSSSIISFGKSGSPSDAAYGGGATAGKPATSGGENNSGGLVNPGVKVEVGSAPLGNVINFSSPLAEDCFHENAYAALERSEGFKKSSFARNPIQAQDHVLAERRRREKLTQRFISLSALLPDLKKLDKASVLANAINHIKQLQQRVQTLEEEVVSAKRKTSEDRHSVAAEKRARVEPGGAKERDSNILVSDSSVAEVEVRGSEHHMLVRICCQKNQGVVKEIFSEIEKLHMTIDSSNVMPFGDSTYHIIVIAQMNERITPEDIASSIRQAILRLI